MATKAEAQLTFNVGGEQPTDSLLTVSGRLRVDRELEKGEEIHVQVVGMDGETVANGYGRVVAVAFKDRFDKDNELDRTERVHSIKVS